jgi:uncharacterized membrane protein YhaH (DUF805 family)
VNWVRLFVSPSGAIGQRTFVHGVIVIVFVNLLMTVAALWLHGPVGWPLLATLYFTACVTTKRLHTFNLSGWVQAPQRAVVAGALLTPLTPTAWWQTHPLFLSAAWVVGILAVVSDATLYLYLAINPRRPQQIEEIFG